MNLSVSAEEPLKESDMRGQTLERKKAGGVEPDFLSIAFPFRAFTNFWAMADKQRNRQLLRGQETIKNVVKYFRTRDKKRNPEMLRKPGFLTEERAHRN